MPVTASSWKRNSLIELNQWRTGSERDEVEQPAVCPLHSSVPGQQEKAATDGEPGQPRADLESENSKDKQDDSDGEVFARKVPDEMLQA